jgi:hypothetical protein
MKVGDLVTFVVRLVSSSRITQCGFHMIPTLRI